MGTHDHGLSHDLEALITKTTDRRQVLRWLTMAGAAPFSYAAGVCSVIPQETGGPYPGDGSNSVNGSLVNVLALSGIIRSDIRSSFAGASGVAAGIPLTIKLNLVNASCEPLVGYAIYLWHCDRDGKYSLYSNGLTGQNYLRGVQEADANGQVTFTTIFPGCYSGRIPHVHLEVYPSLAKATIATNAVRTTQFTFPMDSLNEAYATTGYSQSVTNLSRISYATDNVFSDGTSLQMTSVTGSPSAGYTATLQIAINAATTTTTTNSFGVNVTGSGTNNSFSLSGSLTVATADVGKQGAIYVAARVGSSWYFNNGSSWALFTGSYSPFYSGTLASSHTLNILSGLNVSGICGSPIYVGYGTSVEDMISKSQYKTVYTLCQV